MPAAGQPCEPLEIDVSGPQGPVEARQSAKTPIDPNVRIGHVHLRTADIDRVRDFYVGVLGFDVVAEARDVPGWGTTGDILFVSAGGYHHHLGCTTSRSTTRRVRVSPTRCAASRRRASRCVSCQTTGRTRRSTSPTRTATT